MKYRLNDSYCLEGWRGLPTGLRDTDTGETVFLPQAEYRLLLHMNGIEEISEEALDDREKEILEQLLSRNIIRTCTQDEPLTPEQKYRYFDRTYIAFVHWAITGKCNYRCKHCYMYAPTAKFPEPSMEECRAIIESMQDAGVRSVGLTGGEPLVRRDFLELVDELVSHGIQVHSIYTNGALVTDDLLDSLEKRGQKPVFHISYDGDEYHDWLRGIPGARENAIRAITCCRAHGNEVFAAMCVHRKNRNEIFETVRHLSSLGVSRVRIKFMLPNGMWADEHAADSLSISEATETLIGFIDEFFRAGMPASVIVDKMFHYVRQQKICMIPYAIKCNPNGFLCRKTAVTPYIGPTGVVLPCMTLGGCDFQDRFPNIMKTPLKEIMDHSYYRDVTHMKKSEFFAMHEECHTCAERDICTSGCRACTTEDYLDLDLWNCAFLRGGHWRRVDEAIRQTLEKYHLENEVRYLCTAK